ncbi:MAG TPA: ABC transporter permease [Blastocatellia bacterium]|jgi:putative ABC transport system permease protein|nr:ABC transporter permease [Blastocatellia bacterium]
MDNLVVSNILYRKTRTLTTVAGVALGVVLVLLTVGIANGFLHEQGRRNSAVTAEIMFHPQGSFSLGVSTTLSIPISQAEQIRAMPGVSDAVPVGNLLLEGRVVDGIDYDSFTRVSALRIVEGRPLQSGDEAIVDRVFQHSRNTKVGDEFRLFERSFRIVGIYEPEALGRIKIPLATLQEQLNREGLCSMILVKLDDPAKTEEVARQIKEVFQKNDVRLTRDLPILYARGTPALQTFLKIVVALSVIVSSLVILLAMYTTVTERTRQIGVLKSLGAPKGWIAGEILKEAALISLLGVVAGFAISVAGKLLITRLTSLNVELELRWVIYAFLIGLASGVIGALYPALRAANQDPVKALSYE